MSRRRRHALPSVESLEPRSLLSAALALTPLSSFRTGGFDEGAAEIVAHDPRSQRLFVVNAQAGTVDILSIADPARPVLVGSIDTQAVGGTPNSVDVHDGLVAVAIEDNDKQRPGKVGFYKPNGQFINAVTVGALPDMVTFTPDGRYVLTANEGEPDGAYAVGPEGSVSIIPVPTGLGNVKKLTDTDVRTATFTRFNGQEAALRAQGIRIYGRNATAAQDFEPEYVAVSDDGRTAYVTLQENNALATIDIATATVTRLTPLGYRDYATGGGLDASDRDNAVNIRNWPVFGIYSPDAIAAYTVNGQTYLVTANEGDTRAYSFVNADGKSVTSLNEESRVASLTLDPAAFPDATIKANANLGRLTVTNTLGDTDGDGDFDQLYVPGTRSFSILAADGTRVYDSAADFETITAAALPTNFNASNTNNTFDDRSDNKGPEPEGVTLGVIDGRTYAFIGLERVGGIMVYDVSDPAAPTFVTYVNNRDFAADPEDETALAGDLGPEGLHFIAAADSPTGRPMLAVANEVSGTVTLFAIDVSAAAAAAARPAPAVTGLPTRLANRNATGGKPVAQVAAGGAGFSNKLIVAPSAAAAVAERDPLAELSGERPLL